FLKLASGREQPLRTIVFYAGFVLYASTAFGWVFVMKRLKLSTIGVLYSVSMVLLLGTEDQVHRGHRDVSFPGNRLHRRPRVAVLDEQRPGGPDDRLPGLCRLLLPSAQRPVTTVARGSWSSGPRHALLTVRCARVPRF